jgi:hypothetical protein
MTESASGREYNISIQKTLSPNANSNQFVEALTCGEIRFFSLPLLDEAFCTI